jgi:hypothetical protein
LAERETLLGWEAEELFHDTLAGKIKRREDFGKFNADNDRRAKEGSHSDVENPGVQAVHGSL